MKLNHVSKYYEGVANLPAFILEDLVIDPLPEEITPEFYNQNFKDSNHYAESQTYLRNKIEAKHYQMEHIKQQYQSIVDEINTLLPDILKKPKLFNVWGNLTDEIYVENHMEILEDKPGFYMEPHIDNRGVGSVISINLRDNTPGTGTSFYNLTELDRMNVKPWFINDEGRKESIKKKQFMAKKKVLYDSKYLFTGPSELGTGILWWNHHTTMHGIENYSDKNRYTLYSITPTASYFEADNQKEI